MNADNARVVRVTCLSIQARFLVLNVGCALGLAAGCTERLPQFPPSQASEGRLAFFEGVVERGVAGQAGTQPMPNARVEVLGVGSTMTAPNGRYRLPRFLAGLEDQTLEFLVYDQAEGVDAMPVGRYRYELLAGTSGQIRVDITVGARGSIRGRVALPEGTLPGGVIVFVEGVPGADDLSGPNGDFYLHGVPEGLARVGFMYEDYVVAPRDLIDVTVSAYQATEIPETIQLTPPPGESALAPVTVMVDRHPDVPAEGLEVVISPLLARPWSGSPAEGTGPVKVIPVPVDGRVDLAFDYPEPYTVVLRQRTGTSERPIRLARRVYVRPGDAPIHFNAGYDVASDESGQELGIDTDGDGLPDAQDEDPDGDGCTNEPELTALDPYSCGDRDGDGVGDGFDPDDDGDGMPDLEELTPGSDGRTSDHREDEDQSVPERDAVASPDGVVTILGRGTVNQRAEADELRTLIDRHHTTFGNTLVTPIYEVQADMTSAPELLVQLFGYQGDEESLRLVVGSQTNPSWLNERELPGVNLDCVDVGRGRKTCPVGALRQDLDGEAYLVFISTRGATVTPLCGNGRVEGDEECDDGNPVETDSCLTNCRTARCGDGLVHADVEACDDGNMSNNDACVGEACAQATCGDGYLRTNLPDDHPAFEQCDDGDQDDSNYCTNLCREARCGDGVVNVEIPARDPSFEGCDDGNDDDNDGCRNNCMNEVLPGRLALSAFGGCRQTLDGVWSCWGSDDLGQFGDPVVDASNGGEFIGEVVPQQTNIYRVRIHRAGTWTFETRGENADTKCRLRDQTGRILGSDDDGGIGASCRLEIDFDAATTVQFSVIGYSPFSSFTYTAYIIPPDTENLERPGTIAYRGSPAIDTGSLVSAGANHYCAIAPNGQVRCFGASNNGQSGRNPSQAEEGVETPTGIDGSASVLGSLSSRGNLSCSLRSSDRLARCWGPIRDEGAVDYDTARIFPYVYPVASRRVFALMQAVCAQKEDGTIWCQGNNQAGSLGLGQTEQLERMRVVNSFGKPAQVQGAQWASLDDRTAQLALCAGENDCHNHTCVLHQDRSIRCTGANRWGQVGVAEPAVVRELTTVAFTGFPVSLAVGGYHTCLLDIIGKVHCWGYNGFGQLGQEPSQEPAGHKVSTPTEVPNLSGVTEIAAGAHHTCALVGDQDVRCWGRNTEGQLGFVGDSTHLPTAVQRLLTGHAPRFTSQPPMRMDDIQVYSYEPMIMDADADALEIVAHCGLWDGWDELDTPAVWENGLLRFTPPNIAADVSCELWATDGTGRTAHQAWTIEH